jgi:hypothetical protein
MTMTDVQTSGVVLKDPTGNYFLLPLATLRQYRISEEHKAEMEQFIAGSDVAESEVQGFQHYTLDEWRVSFIKLGAAIQSFYDGYGIPLKLD